MPIPFALKVELSPMLARSMLFQPDLSFGIDSFHIRNCLIVFFLSRSLRRFPQQAAQRRMLEFVAKVPFEMFKAVPMRTMWENRRDTIQQTLLTIGEDG